MLNYYLQDENSHHWEAIQNLASSPSSESADKKLRKYVLEAQRLTSSQRDIRVCVGETTIDGKQYKPGDIVVCLFVRIPELQSVKLMESMLTTIIVVGPGMQGPRGRS